MRCWWIEDPNESTRTYRVGDLEGLAGADVSGLGDGVGETVESSVVEALHNDMLESSHT